VNSEFLEAMGDLFRCAARQFAGVELRDVEFTVLRPVDLKELAASIAAEE
jgi:hypothetical protein